MYISVRNWVQLDTGLDWDMRLVSGVTGRGDEGIFCKTFLLVFNIERFLLFSTTFGAVNTNYLCAYNKVVGGSCMSRLGCSRQNLMSAGSRHAAPHRPGYTTHVYTVPRHHNPPLYPDQHRTPYTIALIPNSSTPHA